jgi:hypothetical protein
MTIIQDLGTLVFTGHLGLAGQARNDRAFQGLLGQPAMQNTLFCSQLELI